MIELLGGLLDVVQLAHDTQMPHQEPAQSGGGGGASTIVILAVVALTLAVLGGLVWLKKRTEEGST